MRKFEKILEYVNDRLLIDAPLTILSIVTICIVAGFVYTFCSGGWDGLCQYWNWWWSQI